LTGGGTSGNVTLDVDLAEIVIPQSQVTDLTTDLAAKQDDVITTQGDLIIGDGSGDASRIAIGSADQVLTSNGTTATWEDAGGGGAAGLVEVVATTTITTGVSSLQITGLSAYSTILVFFSGASSTNDFAFLQLTSVNAVALDARTRGLRVVNSSNGNANGIQTTGISLGRMQSNSNSCAAAILFQNNTDDNFATAEINGGSTGNGDNDQSFATTAIIKKTAVISSLTFSMSSGNFDGGTFEVYGA